MLLPDPEISMTSDALDVMDETWSLPAWLLPA
jgi:hypothetical protein